ncbi:MAG: Rieske (2Fe-2S) protein, partial [Rhodobacteraceae bacterium]|nr:Rieske (2Fe-2S) protein [Paracoccaceae bacterium]
APAAVLAQAFGGEGHVIEGTLGPCAVVALIQPLPGNVSALHLLAPEGAGAATLDALSLAAEALRRTAEAQAEQAEEETA